MAIYIGKPHNFHCTVCNRDVSCGHQGEQDVLCHSNSDLHKKNGKDMKGVQRLNFVPSSEAKKLQDKDIVLYTALVLQEPTSYLF